MLTNSRGKAFVNGMVVFLSSLGLLISVLYWQELGHSNALFFKGKQSYQEGQFSGIISALFFINLLAIKRPC